MAFEWPSLKKGGVVRYTYPADKRPDTNSDLLSLVHIHHFDANFFYLFLIHILQGFITPSFDAVLARIDSHPSEGASPSSSSSADGGEGAADNGAANDKRDFLELSIVSFFRVFNREFSLWDFNFHLGAKFSKDFLLWKFGTHFRCGGRLFSLLSSQTASRKK